MNVLSSRKLKYFSFFFTIAIVVYHCGFIDCNNRIITLVQPLLARFNDFMCCIAMSFFFMKSGYLLHLNLVEEKPINKIRRRFRTLLIPFIVWNFLYMIIDTIVYKINIDGIIGVLYGFTFSPFDGPLWYMFAIFLLSFVTIPLVRICNKKKVVLLISFMLMIMSLCIYGFDVLQVFGLSEEVLIIMWVVRLFRYLPAYIIGSLLGLYKGQVINYSIKEKKLCFILICLTAFFMLAWVTIDSVPKVIKQIILITTPIFMWITIDGKRFAKPESDKIKGAFIMYASHFLIIWYVRPVVARFISQITHEGFAFITWMAYPCVVVVCTYLIAKAAVLVLEIPILYPLKRIMTGNR